ncbi:MAG: DNA-directed RNA polymerase subunit beta [Capsulimonadaceae bacterium]|nr:DNA-directed RNA polymerase subunit beta [Capsulimonadaceae bacterium]
MKEIQHTTKQTQHVVDVPNLVELQLDSYRWFLEEGLRELFESFSPITDFTGNHSIELVDFTLGEPKYDIVECRARDATLESPIKAKVRLRAGGGDVIESDVYLGDLPLMTDKGTFVINGAERVVVSQLARSSGIYFKDTLDFSGRQLYYATLIPNEGAWVDIESDANEVITVRIGQTRKFPITTLLRALNLFPQASPQGTASVTFGELHGKVLAADVIDQSTGEVLLESGTTIGTRETRLIEKADLTDTFEVELPDTACDTNTDILTLFGEPETVENPGRETLYSRGRSEVHIVADEAGRELETPRKRVPFAMTDIRDKNGKILVPAFGKIDRDAARKIEALALESLDILYVNSYVVATMETEPNVIDKQTALIDIYKKIRPSDPATPESAASLMRSIFFDPRRYDLAKVGRHKLNKKLGLSLPLSVRNISREDVIAIVRYIIRLAQNDPEATVDDIDHLENKRVRSIGELLYSQLRLGFLRMEKVAKERMTSMDTENILPQVVLSVKPISASIKSFFGSSQLSQFMDQTNPLAELGHKRRLSALGPGGLSRQSAKLEVRDVHHSHYGRICPIETPEGPNIGLIGQLTVHARVDEFGFIETPYRRVIDGKVTLDLDWLPADGEHQYKIAPASVRLNHDNSFTEAAVQVRHNNEYPVVPAREIEYMDVAPQQLVSVATAIIPFLENDDANRALMGANMQRQAVPTLRPQAPLVKTGMEKRAARDSGAVIMAERDGVVSRVTAEDIIVETENGEADVYRLLNMIRSNQATCITQRPVVFKGQRVRAGDVLADGPCTDGGELALGQNILVAFVPWEGYNFEDAILLSQRLVRDDVYTSIHIEKYEVEARDTKLGPEEITRDIPNVGEDALKDLDENGIIRVGAEVRPDDILVGRVAPKGQSELTAEERLIIAIFGKKAEETRDVSLRVPHGEKGKVVDVKVFSRYKYKDKTGRIFNFSKRPDSLLSDEWEGELERLPGDELSAGVNMLVRTYIAQKRKIMEGDKMAGRHGNKGVVSKILPEEDMPFLPDGTPVDIVLNPLGVPSRMNIGQVLETHLGLVGRALNCSFVEPIFEGSTEKEILGELQRYSDTIRKDILTRYCRQELSLTIDPKRRDTLEDVYGQLRTILEGLEPQKLEDIARIVSAPPAIELPEDVEEPSEEEDTEQEERPIVPIDNYDLAGIMQNVRRNIYLRGGVNEKTGKFRLRNGLTGDYFHQDVTVGQIYMLKLAHLVDDKIHARSTGPYSLVTQQPLGGKAQFGGQRFGEMEVWALEAYGAAYTLQEILTIKSDDVLGRVKTYEAIVKGDAMLEPGVPESFKILVNELQSLGLKVTVEDELDKEIDLKDREEDYDEGRGMRFGGPMAGAPPSAGGDGTSLLSKRGFAASGSLGRRPDDAPLGGV